MSQSFFEDEEGNLVLEFDEPGLASFIDGLELLRSSEPGESVMAACLNEDENGEVHTVGYIILRKRAEEDV
jgi:hypothetical protein